MDQPLSRRDLRELRNISLERINLLSKQIIKEVIDSAKNTNIRYYTKTIWNNVILDDNNAEELCRLLRVKFPDSSIYFMGANISNQRLMVDWS